MRALNTHFVLIDLHSSPWNAAANYHQLDLPPSPSSSSSSSSKFVSSFSSAFPRTHCAPNRSTPRPKPSTHSGIRKPPRPWGMSSSPVVDTSSPNSNSTPRLVSELELFLELVPSSMRNHLVQISEIGDLIEVVMDLGRKPLARFPSGDSVISDRPVEVEDLKHAISKVGDFSDDNRSGIDRSLHRISAIRNRKMQIIGLTCRVGRAVSGSAEMIRDLVQGGGSILVIGPPGVGKTTLIREIARTLADEHMKRVVIVDTSNEIGGDGDVPHSGIGRARRMQVSNVNMQHNVMIEAVENHMPETIVIDEISTELEALAACTIAQRGVQLVGTAHGMTIDNIIKNPSLNILVGGIESATLGDEEARKRKAQKTILERKGAPTFTCAVEMLSRTECRVHHKLDASVDSILTGKSPLFEVRQMDVLPHDKDSLENSQLASNEDESSVVDFDKEDVDYTQNYMEKWSSYKSASKNSSHVIVYMYKILDVDLLQVVKMMGLEDKLDVTDDIGAADAILATSSEMKTNPWIRGVAKYHKLPVFVIKSNTMAQMVKAVRVILGVEHSGSASRQPLKNDFDIEIEDDAPKRKPSLEEIDALEEARLAIEYIVIPGGEPVELLPRCSDIIARQLQLVESYQLAAENSGTELNTRLQILPLKLNRKAPVKCSKSSSSLQRGPACDKSGTAESF